MVGQNVSLNILTNLQMIMMMMMMMMMIIIIIIIIIIIQKCSAISFLLLNTRLPDRNVSGPWGSPFRGRPPPIRFAVGIVQVKQLPVAHHTVVPPPLPPAAACAFSGTPDAQLPACVPTHAASLSCPLGSGGIHPAASDWQYTTSTLSLYLMHAVKPRYSLPRYSAILLYSISIDGHKFLWTNSGAVPGIYEMRTGLLKTRSTPGKDKRYLF